MSASSKLQDFLTNGVALNDNLDATDDNYDNDDDIDNINALLKGLDDIDINDDIDNKFNNLMKKSIQQPVIQEEEKKQQLLLQQQQLEESLLYRFDDWNEIYIHTGKVIKQIGTSRNIREKNNGIYKYLCELISYHPTLQSYSKNGHKYNINKMMINSRNNDMIQIQIKSSSSSSRVKKMNTLYLDWITAINT